MVAERFYSKVSKGEQCWEWTAATSDLGYGHFWLDGGMRLAHRVAWEMANGPIPEGMEIDHKCRNRGCVNVAHLEPIPHRENMRRAQAVKTHCPKGHPYSGSNLAFTKKGARKCRACHALTNNAARNRRAEGVA